MDEQQPTEKPCRSCGEVKPIERFRPHKRMASGRVNTCYDCLAAKARAKRAEDPEEWRRKKRAYYHANREQEVQRLRDWKAANPAHNLRRRLEVRGGHIPDETVVYGLILTRDPCAYCGGPANSLDHIIPMKVGGTHDWDNFTAACKSCNSRKNDRTLLDALMRDRLAEDMANWSTRWEAAA